MYKMAEKLCLQWNDFQENIKSAFGHLRGTTDFVDVTLACEDGQQMEAHKVILAASCPFFQRILKGNKHSHPLIYMRGVNSDDMTAIIDFLYYGEANVYQENLEGFLAIAEELQIKGLEGSKDQYGSNEKEELCPALPKTPLLAANLQELDETVKEMMKTSENKVQVGNRQRRAKICKVCGKEGYVTDIMRHIETHHLEGLSVPCNLCDKRIRSRNALRAHMIKQH